MKDEMIKMQLDTVASSGYSYFFTVHGSDALFRYDVLNDSIILETFLGLNARCESLFLKSFCYNNEIWLIPGGAANIVVYNYRNSTVESIGKACSTGSKQNKKIKYNNFLVFENHFLCLVPREEEDSIIINMDTKKVEDEFRIAVGNIEYQNAIINENKIHFFPRIGNKKAIVDLSTKEISYVECKGDQKYGDSVFDEPNRTVFRAPGRANHIRVETLDGKTLNKIFIENKQEGYRTFFASKERDEILFWGMNEVLRLSIPDNKLYYEKVILDKHDQGFLFPINNIGKDAYIYGGNHILLYNVEKNKYEVVNLLDLYEICIREQIDKGISIDRFGSIVGMNPYMECGLFELKDFICHVTEQNI